MILRYLFSRLDRAVALVTDEANAVVGRTRSFPPSCLAFFLMLSCIAFNSIVYAQNQAEYPEAYTIAASESRRKIELN